MYGATFLQIPFIEVFEVAFVLIYVLVVVITTQNDISCINRSVTDGNDAIKTRVESNRVDSLLFSRFGG